jgi:toxin-antitoxin system PIN domain toxin
VIVLDVNLLLYAVITGFPQHRATSEWFETTINGPTQIGLTSPAVFGFLRLSTNPRVLESPLAVDTAIGYVQEWLERPSVEFLRPGPRHLEIAFELLRGIGTAGNLTTDVQLAAYAIELDAELCSNDADFGRFARLRWFNPLARS